MSTSVSSPQAANNADSARSSAGRARSQGWGRVWIIGAAALLVVLVGAFVIRTQGSVSGSEFSPSHFQIREFQFYEIPILHLQITPILRKVSPVSLGTYLQGKSMIKSGKGAPQTWHLVNLSRGLSGNQSADANLLLDQLELETLGEAFWRTWSDDQPERAKVLWPIVQRLADRELYVLLPELFEIALNAVSADQLKSLTDDYLQKRYVELITDMREADHQEIAANLLIEARQDYPESAAFDFDQFPGIQRVIDALEDASSDEPFDEEAPETSSSALPNE